MIAKLIPLDGSPPLLIIREVTLVGRKGGECDIALEHPSISKLHCAVLVADGLLVVRDLGSTNGTRVNGQRVRRGTLLPNDHLALAKFQYQFRVDDTPDLPAAIKDLVDDAFLRRIPYKIEVPNPTEDAFRKLFGIMSKVLKIPFNADSVDYLIAKYYKPVNRPYRNCHPRDLLLQIRSYCYFNEVPIEMKNEYMDFAVDNYFSMM